jgi:hypothetical protein
VTAKAKDKSLMNKIDANNVKERKSWKKKKL